MTIINSESELKRILYTGAPTLSEGSLITDDLVDETIRLVKYQCLNNPNYVYQIINQFLYQDLLKPNGFLVLLLAGLISYNTNIDKNKITLIICDFDCYNLLQLINSFKYKFFGKGLGSSIQKLIRKTIENSWNFEKLEKELVFNSQYLYRILRLIHPRLKGKRGQLIRSAFPKFCH